MIGPRSDTQPGAGPVKSSRSPFMPFEKLDFENLSVERRASIAKSIRTISEEELKKVGEEIFLFIDDPWRETFFRFIAENRGSTFHYALTSDEVHIVYCRDKDKGMWFLPGTGKGPLQAKGRQTMKEMIESRH
jgi:hypothetical protein